jgi:ribosomal protein S7
MVKAAIEEAISQVAPELEGVQIEDGAVRQAVPVTFIPPRRHRERENDHASVSPS